MTHIKTASKAETSMRSMYPVATDENPIKAEPSHIETIARIIENTRKMDLLKLEISKDVGSLMGYVQGHAALIDDQNRELLTWRNGKDRQEIDYESLLIDLDVQPSVVAKYTKTKRGARTFTIVSD